jgi:hypothetical protein
MKQTAREIAVVANDHVLERLASIDINLATIVRTVELHDTILRGNGGGRGGLVADVNKVVDIVKAQSEAVALQAKVVYGLAAVVLLISVIAGPRFFESIWRLFVPGV